MTLGWLDEATNSVDLDSDPEDGHHAVIDRRNPQNMPPGAYNPGQDYGGQTAALPGPSPGSRMHRDSNGGSECSPLDAKTLLPLCPDEAWRQAVEPDMARRMLRLTAILATGRRAAAGLCQIRACLKDDPKLARQLAEQYLGNWLNTLLGRSPDDSSQDRDAASSWASNSMVYQTGPNGVTYAVTAQYYNGSPYGNSGGVPLIRAKQVRNLAALAGEIKAIRELGHTAVSRRVDRRGLRCVPFARRGLPRGGSAASVRRPHVALAGTGRATHFHHADQAGWPVGQARGPAAGQHAADRQGPGCRDPPRLCPGGDDADSGRKRSPGKADIVALRAAVVFDQSEFLYGQKADLKTYTALRNRAFADFQRAADLYAKALPSLPPEQQSPQVYIRWYQSALGASDLAYLTRQDKPDADQDRARGGGHSAAE